ncbi:MAG: ABC transporter permease [Lachnospiraceae bacterium]|nr:ABC transporter permease [Lachnospiraceae bacterium]
MKFKKEDFKGTAQVYRFTFWQLFKARANLLTLLLLLVFSLFSMPIYILFNGGSTSGSKIETENSLRTVYYLNETPYETDWEALRGSADKTDAESADGTNAEMSSGLELVSALKADVTEKNWEEKLSADAAFVHILPKKDAPGFDIRVFGNVDSSELTGLSDAVRELFEQARYSSAGVTKEQINQAFSGFTVEVDTLKSYQAAAKIDPGTAFAVQYIYAILVLILCTFSTTFIVRAIIEEKASKLVETLLISVRPLAMILGKILAVMTYVFGMILMMAAGVAVSYQITDLFMDTGVVREQIAMMGLNSDLIRFGPSTIGIVLISLVLGYFTFSIIGGIAGTSCSSMEDVESANMNVILLVLAGYMVSCVTASFGGTVGLVTSFIPFASIFCAPVQYVLGSISFPVLLLAWLIQLLVVAWLALFCARIYEDLIMYRGGKMKFGRMLALARRKKMGGDAK